MCLKPSQVATNALATIINPTTTADFAASPRQSRKRQGLHREQVLPPANRGFGAEGSLADAPAEDGQAEPVGN